MRVGRCTVERLMRRYGIVGVGPAKATRTTFPGSRPVPAADLVRRNFTASRPDQLWLADFTYVRTWQGWAYLAVVLDVHTRRIVGWQLAPHMRQSLVSDAFEMALHARREHAGGLVAHSDNGAQGEFKRSSQHLDNEELRWDHEVLDAVVVRCVLRYARRAGLQAGAGSISGSSGQRSLEGFRARMRPSPSVSHQRSAGAGSVKLAACEPSAPNHLPAVTCPSPSERRSRSCAPEVRGAEIARQLGRSPSTISRELRRNAATRSGRSSIGRRRRSGMPTGVLGDPRSPSSRRTTSCAATCRSGSPGLVQRPDGSVAGPDVRWGGRRHGRARTGVGRSAWSPEQISSRLRLDFPDDESMRVSHEAIYQSLYVQGRGALRRELTACLRTGRALRVPRAEPGAGQEAS